MQPEDFLKVADVLNCASERLHLRRTLMKDRCRSCWQSTNSARGPERALRSAECVPVLKLWLQVKFRVRVGVKTGVKIRVKTEVKTGVKTVV